MNTSTSVKTEKLSETDVFSFLTQYAYDHHFSMAFWRLPNQLTKQAILAEHHQPINKNDLVEDLSAGFIVAPFEKEKESIFLPADLIFTFENDCLKSPENPAEIKSSAWLSEFFSAHATKKAKLEYSKSQTQETTETAFTNLVTEGLKKIEEGVFEKIVPSRTKVINLPDDFDAIKSFQKLCNTYPNALVSLISIPGIGTWLGATPEALVCIQDKTIFKTVALAGTKAFNETINIKSVAWTQKEIEEQALVERYIISCFKKIRLREYDEYGPKTVVAGNLMHLKSEFTVDMKATNFPQLGSTMLQLLHPTSAVCGVPLEPSREFLKTYENYNREFYAGYLGPVNVNNNISIFVNIRCMQLLVDKAICYAGAGVTSDSVPEEEWLETELKLNTLLSVIM